MAALQTLGVIPCAQQNELRVSPYAECSPYHAEAQSVCAGWESVGDTMQVVMEYVKKCNEECLAMEQVLGVLVLAGRGPV